MIQLRPLFDLTAQVAAPQVTPDGPYGTRRMVPVIGGTFRGQRLSGSLLSGGSDCQLIRPDGVAELDVRVTLQTDDGSILQMRGLGLRHADPEVMRRLAEGEPVCASAYYFRETMTFEASQGPYAWINRIIAVGSGERRPDSVHIRVFEVL